jgi:hypothetical protein
MKGRMKLKVVTNNYIIEEVNRYTSNYIHKNVKL